MVLGKTVIGFNILETLSVLVWSCGYGYCYDIFFLKKRYFFNIMETVMGLAYNNNNNNNNKDIVCSDYLGMDHVLRACSHNARCSRIM
jgi:hypothetical protein